MFTSNHKYSVEFDEFIRRYNNSLSNYRHVKVHYDASMTLQTPTSKIGVTKLFSHLFYILIVERS